jgi:tetratricopeptide (TPR) repeat protein
MLYRSIQDYSTALSYFDIALEIWQTSLPPDHSDLTTIFNNISETYYIMGDYSSALSYLKKVFEICQTSLPSSQALLATNCSSMAAIFDKLDQNEEAIKYAEQSVDFIRRALGDDHTETKKYQNYLEQLRRKYDESKECNI